MIVDEFAAMGTTIEVRCPHPAGPAATRRLFADVEAVASRFRPDSDLSRLNDHPADRVPVDGVLSELLGAASAVRRMTGGLVDAAVGGDVARWGYDRTFREVAARSTRPAPARSLARWTVADGVVARPPGTRLDLGGIAKGWTADRAVESGRAVIVSAGGDVRSAHPDAEVRVVGPDGGVAVIALGARALATSSVARRRWRVGGGWAHHLIDPRTGAPAVGPVVSATAVAATATLAEAAAKAVLLHGVDGLAWAAERPWVDGALVVWEDGAVYATTGLEVAA
ncbi:MAG: FAD:protein FMN transferase [Acidimicrobiia bacterium]